MRANWSTGIVMAFAIFITFILYFVLKVQGDAEYDHEMVTEDYYKKEIGFQTQLDKQQNAMDLSERVAVINTTEGLEIHFPKSFDWNQIQGKVSLYRPSNQQLDFDIPISLSSSNLLIPKTKLAGGRWDITIDWNYNGKGFLNKETVNL
ncbi:FixH family protein [Flavobacterium sp. GCM10027622]|uniref:FixH family protein n=1 Tax=unclassified Flavobacterium TaxID=196869 RepID=UPI00361853AB